MMFLHERGLIRRQGCPKHRWGQWPRQQGAILQHKGKASRTGTVTLAGSFEVQCSSDKHKVTSQVQGQSRKPRNKSGRAGLGTGLLTTQLTQVKGAVGGRTSSPELVWNCWSYGQRMKLPDEAGHGICTCLRPWSIPDLKLWRNSTGLMWGRIQSETRCLN